MCVALLTSVCFTGHFSWKKKKQFADTVLSWNQPTVITILSLQYVVAMLLHVLLCVTSSRAPSLKRDQWHRWRHQINLLPVFHAADVSLTKQPCLRCGTGDGVQLVGGPFIWKWLLLSTHRRKESCSNLDGISSLASVSGASQQNNWSKWLPTARTVVQVSGEP